MVEAMHTLQTTGQLPSEVQDESLVTYAHKLEKSESAMDWTQPAIQLSRQVRAFNPFPVATARFRDQVCKLWFAQVAEGSGEPGTILQTQPLLVACGTGALEIQELQMPGGKRQTAQQFVQGQHVQAGDRFF